MGNLLNSLCGSTLMPLSLIQVAQFCLDSYRTPATYHLEDLGVQIHTHGTHCCFRGTDSILDWKFNIHTEFKYIRDGIRIHAGYQKLFMGILQSGVPMYSFKSFSGHSAGGVLAGMFAQHQESHAITFGAPRYLGQATNIKKLIRVYSKYDPITRLPLWITGMKHPASNTRELSFIGHSMTKYYAAIVNQ